jgi:hypothetical protein
MRLIHTHAAFSLFMPSVLGNAPTLPSVDASKTKTIIIGLFFSFYSNTSPDVGYSYQSVATVWFSAHSPNAWPAV